MPSRSILASCGVAGAERTELEEGVGDDCDPALAAAERAIWNKVDNAFDEHEAPALHDERLQPRSGVSTH